MPIWLITWLGMRKELDVTPLQAIDELRCILAGISTWQATPNKPTFSIELRIENRIRRHPAPTAIVLNTHYCRTNEMIGTHPTYFQYTDFTYHATEEPPF